LILPLILTLHTILQNAQTWESVILKLDNVFADKAFPEEPANESTAP